MMSHATKTRSSTGEIQLLDLGSQRRRLGDRIDVAIGGVLDHGAFIMGPEVAALEDRLSSYSGGTHVISCSSGTDALVLALLALGIGPGDTVLVPSFTFAATAEAVALAGATPALVDVRPDTFAMDPNSAAATVESLLGTGRSPRALIAVDLFGQPVDYDSLRELCARYDLRLVADAAQSFGATWRGRKVGSIADVTTTSFFPAKPLGCYGDGGAVFAADDATADVLRSLRVHGQGSDKYENVRVGMNGRMDTLQAAVLIEKLAIFDDEVAARRRIAGRYQAELAGVVQVPIVAEGATTTWAQFTVLTDDRDQVRSRLADAGIPSAVHYRLAVHQQPGYRHCPRAPGGLPVSERLARRVLSLPLHPYLTEEMQGRVIDAVREAVAV